MKLDILRWILLLFAAVLAATSLLTAFKPPVRMNWQLRMIAGIVVGEFGFGLAVLPLVAGEAAWFLRRGHPSIAMAAIGLSAVAFVLLLKPTVHAMRLGRDLPARLSAAFGPVSMDRPPFSIAALLANRSEPGAFETIKYSGSLKLDLYRASGRSPAPCVVAIHGGAWCRGDRTESSAVAQLNCWIARHGYAVASIDYRLVPESRATYNISGFAVSSVDKQLAPDAIWPAQRDDVRAAVAFLRANAPELGIDPAKFILLGRSAGAQLAEAVAYSSHDSGIRGVIAIYGPADLALSWETTRKSDSFPLREILQQFLGGTPAVARGAYDSASGALLAGHDSPPTLLLHGELDTIVPHDQSELLAARLSAAGVPNALVSIPWATHGFDYVSFNSPGGQITAYAIGGFLSALTK